nr:immunoglobulin heavy chain junction region [Macaca mulatta]
CAREDDDRGYPFMSGLDSW